MSTVIFLKDAHGYSKRVLINASGVPWIVRSLPRNSICSKYSLRWFKVVPISRKPVGTTSFSTEKICGLPLSGLATKADRYVIHWRSASDSSTARSASIETPPAWMSASRWIGWQCRASRTIELTDLTRKTGISIGHIASRRLRNTVMGIYLSSVDRN